MNETINKRFANVSRSKTFLNIVSTFDLKNKKVLDIGCSNGEFLAHFGPDSLGLTIIEEEVKEGQSRGLNISLANIEDENFYLDEKFDVIFANNIFEHMQSPHNFLLKIKSFLNENGTLILGVPCIPYITPLMYLNKFRGALASLHINFFTRSTLAKTAEFAGWTVVENRGFHFKNRFLDFLLNPIYPHFYVVGRVNKDFKYSNKRLKELEGYNR